MSSITTATTSTTNTTKTDLDTKGSGMNKQICDMDDHIGEMKSDCLNIASQAIDSNVEEKNIAKTIKRTMDAKYGPNWVVVVGSEFKAYVTYEAKTMFFFYIGKTAICMYKAG